MVSNLSSLYVCEILKDFLQLAGLEVKDTGDELWYFKAPSQAVNVSHVFLIFSDIMLASIHGLNAGSGTCVWWSPHFCNVPSWVFRYAVIYMQTLCSCPLRSRWVTISFGIMAGANVKFLEAPDVILSSERLNVSLGAWDVIPKRSA